MQTATWIPWELQWGPVERMKDPILPREAVCEEEAFCQVAPILAHRHAFSLSFTSGYQRWPWGTGRV